MLFFETGFITVSPGNTRLITHSLHNMEKVCSSSCCPFAGHYVGAWATIFPHRNQGRISTYKFLVPYLSMRVKFTNQENNGKSRTLRINMVFVCYLLLK